MVLGRMHVSPEMQLQNTGTASEEQPRFGSIQYRPALEEGTGQFMVSQAQ